MAQHVFTRGSEEKRTTHVTATRTAVEIESGIENLIVLKTAGSAFEGYKKDRYTTLKETTDRVFATAIKATWTYRNPQVEFGHCWQQARAAILKTFIERDSLSVQHTAYAMGEAVLKAVEDITGDPPVAAKQALPANRYGAIRTGQPKRNFRPHRRTARLD